MKFARSWIITGFFAVWYPYAYPGPPPGAGLESDFRAHFMKARAAQNAGDLETAVREYQAAASLKPDFAEIHMNIGLVLHVQLKFEASAAALAKSLELNPALFAAGLFQGINYCKLGRPADAVPLLTRAAAQQPADKQVLFWLGSALVGSGRSTAAVNELEKASEILRDDIDILQLLGEAYQAAARDISEQVRTGRSDSPERRLMLADSFLDQQEWMAAEIYYSRLLTETPAPVGTHLGLATALLRQGKLEKARVHYEQHLLADPWSPDAHSRLAEVAILEGRLPEALEHFRAVIRIRPASARSAVEAFSLPTLETPDPSRAFYEAAVREWAGKAATGGPGVRLGLALAYMRVGNSQASESQLAEMTRELPLPKPAPPVSSRAEALQAVRKRRYEAAIEPLRRHLQTRPSDVEAGVALVESYLETQRPADAARELRRILNTGAKRPAPLLLLAKCYRDLALKTFEHLVLLQPDSYRAHQLLGESYAARKQYDSAFDEYRAALAAKPNLPGLHLAIGRVHLKLLRFEEAAVEFEKELEINPFDADANIDLGGIYVNQDQPEKAVPLLERALRVRPGFAEAHRRLGKACYNLGLYDRAESEL
jgi:tetratricopeptide (TPR) repeat protein